MPLTTLNIDLNRVEGDLEFQVDLDGDTVVDARCVGTLFRGFEQLLIGRAPRDALVITPRVCGICGTAHLYTAALALERLAQIPVSPHATLVRNLCLMAENVQSDLRQSFLFFTPDLVHRRYADEPLFADVERAFAPLKGRIVRGALGATRKILELVAIFGGQWPHSSYMLPGGITRGATARDLVDCHDIVAQAREWYEQDVIGDTLEHWLALDSADAFFAWLDTAAPAGSALGLLTQFARSIGLQHIGAGAGHFLSAGSWHDPQRWQPPYGEPTGLIDAGLYDGQHGTVTPFDPALINEHVRHAWYRPYPGGRHPYDGETVPDYQPDSDRYTWAKAPRYGDAVVETGPLAELLVGGDRLIRDLLRQEGPNTWLRQFARLRRAGLTLHLMKRHLDDLAGQLGTPHFLPPPDSALADGEGFGLVQAARGTLGHWIRVEQGRISRYQIITPTAWNASPKDSNGRHGHWEQSVIGVRLADPGDPVEIGHIIRAHDPCLVCTVHVVGRGTRHRYGI
ncbi:MAG TPA: nickel-dependent hydrogenase large subunit [Rhodocyclaceae bacterium]|uniref:nickel-dependent hydrogenase large subunit n=1 Tax=Zoogloea sp. TaxID=49181 RepID=UPI002BBEE92D|nr:nickel-dependent hydrogenase large subunit [Zoogloea sp.]HNC79165.1 nickel-dependent hydrogenase large subunit [Rhodocyclaceae bacterium]HND25291.1 nickel-dependent hydrogenase large subunit [Rhodocyclaceae bacterium]HNH16852.1 nickel-dependent hydrogenase large subunit [Zoogloea sp.]